MRLLTAAFLIICMSLSVHAGEKPLVVSTVSIIQDIAMQVGGSLFRYEMIVPYGGDPHLYDPTPSDAALCTQADVLLQNGLTFEGWITKLIDNSGSKAPVVTVSDGITPISSTRYANATDPHAWMDVTHGIAYAKNIALALAALLPSGTGEIQHRLQDYLVELETLDRYITDKIQAIPPDKRILITSHDAFHYYGDRYGLRLESILGTSTDVDVQTADMRRLNDVIRTTRVPAVFVESTVNPRMLEQIARDNHIVVGGKLYSDSLSDKDGPASTYIAMLRYNTDTIFEGLNIERTEGNSAAVSSVWLWILLCIPVAVILIIIGSRIMRRR